MSGSLYYSGNNLNYVFIDISKVQKAISYIWTDAKVICYLKYEKGCD